MLEGFISAFLLFFVSISIFKFFLSPLHFSIIKLIFCCEIEIFSSLKKLTANFESVSLLSGYVGIQTKFLFFSNRDLSFDLVSRIPAFKIIFILLIYI